MNKVGFIYGKELKQYNRKKKLKKHKKAFFIILFLLVFVLFFIFLLVQNFIRENGKYSLMNRGSTSHQPTKNNFCNKII